MLNNSQVTLRSGFHNYELSILCYVAENGLSFIETSALDSSNVELAFQRILTGTEDLINLWSRLKLTICSFVEIYRIVSNKALENSDNQIKPTGGETISVTPTPDNKPSGSKCC
jgi:Ras-related protein Rab-11A